MFAVGHFDSALSCTQRRQTARASKQPTARRKPEATVRLSLVRRTSQYTVHHSINRSRYSQWHTVNDATKSPFALAQKFIGEPAHLKAYAAGSLLLFIDARMINARSCRKFERHPDLGRRRRGAGASAVRRSVRVLQAVVLCQASANHWTASRSLKSELVICREMRTEKGLGR